MSTPRDAYLVESARDGAVTVRCVRCQAEAQRAQVEPALSVEPVHRASCPFGL